MALLFATALRLTNETPTRKAETKEIVDLLLAHGADANRTDVHGGSPLQYALMGRDYAASFVAAKKLLNAGADINPILSPDKPTPLMWVLTAARVEFHSTGIRENRAELVKLLIKSGADVNESNDDGSVLHIAAAFDYELTKILLDAGADKKVKTSKGLTPIHAALLFGNFKVIPLLLTY
jgi:ankyrin repeat protein